MNYYPFHIGDYASATRHLSWLEDAAYRRLLDVYYVKEEPLPLDERQIFRLVVATTDEQREAVRVILEEFFDKTQNGYSHDRCNAEIKHAQNKKEKASQSAQKKWSIANERKLEQQSQSIGNANAYANADANVSTDTCERIETQCEGYAPNPNPNSKPKPRTREPVGFAEFWDAYPKKVGKGDAEKAYRAIVPLDLEATIAAVRRQAASPQWQKDGGQFIPNPATWLRQKRWLDEPVPQLKAVRGFVC